MMSPLFANTVKTKRFRFDKQFDVLLVHTVSMLEAHYAKHGETEKKFEGVMAEFCSHPKFLKKHNTGVSAQKFSTLRDRVMKLVHNRRTANKRNVAASGIIEDYGELEVSLNTLILEMDRKREEEKEAKEELAEKEKALIDSGVSIRASAMKRPISSTSDCEEDTPKKKKKKLSVIDLTGESELDLMQAEAKHRRETERKRLELEGHRITLAEESQKAQMELMRAWIAKFQ